MKIAGGSRLAGIVREGRERGGAACTVGQSAARGAAETQEKMREKKGASDACDWGEKAAPRAAPKDAVRPAAEKVR